MPDQPGFDASIVSPEVELQTQAVVGELEGLVGNPGVDASRVAPSGIANSSPCQCSTETPFSGASTDAAPASVSVSGEYPISVRPVARTSAPSARAISWAPKHTPNVARPAASLRPIPDLVDEEGVRILLVDADRASQHHQQVRGQEGVRGERVDTHIQVVDFVVMLAQQRGEHPQIRRRRDAARRLDDRSCISSLSARPSHGRATRCGTRKPAPGSLRTAA